MLEEEEQEQHFLAIGPPPSQYRPFNSVGLPAKKPVQEDQRFGLESFMKSAVSGVRIDSLAEQLWYFSKSRSRKSPRVVSDPFHETRMPRQLHPNYRQAEFSNAFHVISQLVTGAYC